ncbi:hypothetical protein BC829DRAFT_96334 [Chytridium lagenaria]|nr:hypothetical protein BC829DRAFT_96334 [Chytridium lagenaria]
MIQTPSGGARSSSLPPIDSSLPQPSPLNHRLTNLDIPYADHQLLRWTTVRVSTSSGSFLVASPPGSTMSDLLAESNRLMLKNLREAQVITGAEDANGDMFDEECPVAALLGAGQGKIMEVLGLTEEEEKEWPVRLHEAFSGKKKVVPEKEHAGTDMILSVTSTGGRTRAVSNVGSVHNLEINGTS